MARYHGPVDYAGDWLPILLFGSMILLFLGGTTACVVDWAKSEKQTHEVTVIDKWHKPGHYEEECHDIDVGEISVPVCSNVWKPPTWTVRYEDGSARFDTRVGQGLYDALKLGDRVWVMFDEGGLFGGRYGETIMTKLPGVER